MRRRQIYAEQRAVIEEAKADNPAPEAPAPVPLRPLLSPAAINDLFRSKLSISPGRKKPPK